jgi:hypothetical protein
LSLLSDAHLDPAGPLPFSHAVRFGSAGYASAPGIALGSGTSLEFWAKESDRTMSHVVATTFSAPAHSAVHATVVAFASPDTSASKSFDGLQVFDISTSTGQLSALDSSSPSHWWQGWHYFVVTFDPAGLRMYEDANLLAVGTPPVGSPYPPATFVLANNPVYNSPFDGSLAQVAVYNQILSPGRINIHYASATSGLDIEPANLHVSVGATAYFTPHSVTPSGQDISASDIYFVIPPPIEIPGIPGLSSIPNFASCVPINAHIACTGLTPGLRFLLVRNAAGQVGGAELWVDPPPTSFVISPAAYGVLVNAPAIFNSSSFSATGEDVSLSDSFSVLAPDGVTCSAPYQRANDWAVTCSAPAASTYTLQFVDLAGLRATSRLLVSAS